MKIISNFLVFLSFVLLMGCNVNKEEITWHETKEKAINYGLNEEGIDENEVLSVEKIENETVIFYKNNQALGIASLTESDKGFSWYRSRSYTDFKGVTPFTTAGFTYVTKSGLSISILAGKAFHDSIIKMKLIEEDTERELEIDSDSRLFYAVHEQPFRVLELTPVMN